MLFLQDFIVKEVESYFNLIKKNILTEINSSKLPASIRNYLSEDQVKKIICSKPSDLIKFHNSIIPKLGNNYTIKEYNSYCKIKTKKASDRNSSEKKCYNKYNTKISQLNKIFDYYSFLSTKKSRSYYLASIFNRNTCTYCNRLYANTIITTDKKTHKVNDSTRIVRPQFDHWFSRGKYPILALSFYNLIPCCSVCNSSIKGSTEFTLNKHIHPHINEKGESFKFSFICKNIVENNVVLHYKKKSKTGKTLNAFKIKDVYNSHSAYELKDLIDLRYKYTENYLDTLFNKTFDLNINKFEAYRMIFGVEYNEKDFHKRSFSKFKKDILNELGIKI